MRTSRSLPKSPSQACAPSFGAACAVPEQLQLHGRRCALRPSRASGVRQGETSACCFYDAVLDARRVAHGDDFAIAGYDADLDI
eukprot:10151657-Alexandrium_andersonii.AAC.1